jgi:hypothetical protein
MWIAVVAAGATFVLALTFAWNAFVQSSNARTARQHVAVLAPLIHFNPAFRHVHISASYTGCILLHGSVEMGRLAELKAQIESSHPPVEVNLQVRELPPQMKLEMLD